MNTTSLTAEQLSGLHDLAEAVTDYLHNTPENTAGLELYLVGGAIRDAIHAPQSDTTNDWDFVVVGESKDSMVDRGFQEIDASSFPIFHDNNREEYALARTETKPEDAFGYKGFQPETTDVTLTEDLARRDLRMNALALEVANPDATSDNLDLAKDEFHTISTSNGDRRLIDRFGGLNDIQTGTIHHINKAFAEDPLRVLRAARYAARYQCDDKPFTIAEETKQLMRRVVPELNLMSKSRIGEEVEKSMKQAVSPSEFWRVLADVGALAVVAPRLDRARIVPAGPDKYHREGDTFTHSMIVLEQMHRICEEYNISGVDRVRRYLMAVTHDLGKVAIASDKGGLFSDEPPKRFGGHAEVGTATAEQFGEKLGLDTHYVNTCQDAAEEHMRIHDLPTWGLEDIIEYVETYTYTSSYEKPYGATLSELIDLAHADTRGRFQNKDVFEKETDYEEAEAAPDGAARATFNRDQFELIIGRTKQAIESTTGYEVMRSELHGQIDDVDAIDDDNLAATLAQTDGCRSPGKWIGEELTERRAVDLHALLNIRLNQTNLLM